MVNGLIVNVLYFCWLVYVLVLLLLLLILLILLLLDIGFLFFFQSTSSQIIKENLRSLSLLQKVEGHWVRPHPLALLSSETSMPRIFLESTWGPISSFDSVTIGFRSLPRLEGIRNDPFGWSGSGPHWHCLMGSVLFHHWAVFFQAHTRVLFYVFPPICDGTMRWARYDFV